MGKRKTRTTDKRISQALEAFAKEHRVDQKGFLCVGLVVTRSAKSMTFPISPQDFLAASAGQVRGLGKTAVQHILRDYGISRVLAEEGGRTSRGSIRNMSAYVDFLNRVSPLSKADLDEVETWWIGRVKKYFTGKPFKLRIDASRSLRSAVRDILDQAERRQREQDGTMYVGAVMQHLVGAKLELALDMKLQHHGFSVADAPSERPGDFFIGDVAIHVTRTPNEALIRKCMANLDGGLRVLIVTSQKGVISAESLADAQNVEDRIDVFEIEQFLATNIYEIAKFTQKAQKVTAGTLVAMYNKILGEHETDPSLSIVVA